MNHTDVFKSWLATMDMIPSTAGPRSGQESPSSDLQVLLHSLPPRLFALPELDQAKIKQRSQAKDHSVSCAVSLADKTSGSIVEPLQQKKVCN